MFILLLLCLLSLARISIAFDSLPGFYSTQFNFTVVQGIFLQSALTTNASTFNFTTQNFGLINRTYPSDAIYPHPQLPSQWQRLTHYINNLNAGSPKNTVYRLLYLARHGEGFHNVAESYYGTPAWNCYWSLRDGNGSVVWADARITQKGESQALAVRVFWEKLVAEQHIKLPESFYSSPLMRCLQTLRLTWSHNWDKAEGRRGQITWQRFSRPMVKEGFREGISAHTCDRRSSKSFTHSKFPQYRFEPGFSEADELWRPLQSETKEAEDARSRAALDNVFRTDKSTVISITSHSGEIASLLRVLGHRQFSLSTGAVLPVLVKTTAFRAKLPTIPSPAFSPASACTTAPMTRDSSCNDCSCCS